MTAWDHRRTAARYASTAALVRHHAETLLAAHQPPPPPPEPVPDPPELTRCPCHGEWTIAGCPLDPKGPSQVSYPPERYEAERDEHETAQARGQCTFADPCPACERNWKR